jgi:hypothetical protein
MDRVLQVSAGNTEPSYRCLGHAYWRVNCDNRTLLLALATGRPFGTTEIVESLV